ncbi:MAG: alpha/beta fold hydrolase [Saccharothrix sp.]|nr:alpha/beta fold hydrolase [Saccharothrix sp.]
MTPPLPDRPDTGLPHPFARSQLDDLDPAFALTPDGPVVSTDAWSGRHLARLSGGRWHRITAGTRWHRAPRWAGALEHDTSAGPDDEPDPSPEPVRHPSRPDLAVSPVRGGRVAVGGEVVDVASVVAAGPWLSDDELLVVCERWPARLPFAWHLRTRRARPLLVGGGVASGFRRADDLIGFCWTAGGHPRRLELVADGVFDIRDTSTARPVIVPGPVCPLPCLVHEPAGPPRGTVVLLHGGPNGAHLDTWSPLVDTLVTAGWRIVRPNVRGSGLRDEALRPPRPARYGVEDVEDVCAVIRGLAVGPVVVGGTSYGGYLAARTAHAPVDVRGVFLLGGFLTRGDLVGTAHPGVEAFLAAAVLADDAPPAPVPHFVAHGTHDRRIPFDAVAAHRYPPGSEVVAFAGGHGVRTDPAARVVFPALFAWLAERG